MTKKIDLTLFAHLVRNHKMAELTANLMHIYSEYSRKGIELTDLKAQIAKFDGESKSHFQKAVQHMTGKKLEHHSLDLKSREDYDRYMAHIDAEFDELVDLACQICMNGEDPR